MTNGNRRAFFYGWIIVGVFVLLQLTVFGGRFSFGVFFKPLSEELQWSRSLTSGGFSLNILLSGVFSPLAGWLVDRYGARYIISLGAVLGAILTALIATTSQVWHFYLVFGILHPLVLASPSLTVCSAVLARWFVRARGTVTAMISSGASVGQLILAPILGALVVSHGWRSSMLVLAGVMFVIALPGFFLLRERPGDLGQHADGVQPSEQSTPEAAAAPPLPRPNFSLREASRTAPFWLLNGGFFVCGWSVGVVGTHLPAFTNDLGYSFAIAGYLLAVIGGANVISTLVYGGLCDRFGKKSFPLASVYFLRGLALLMLPFAQSLTMLYVFAVLIGIAWLSTVPMTFGLASDHYGLKNLATIIGVIFMWHQIGSAISTWLAGWWFDRYQNYDAMWVLAAILCFAATLVSAVIKERTTIEAAMLAKQPAAV